MDVWHVTVVVLRRWYVFLPLLALTVVAVLLTARGIDPRYEVAATAVLVPGRVDTEIENPYGTMNSTNEVLAIVLNSSDSRSSVDDLGLDPDYQVRARSNSRIMDLTVVSDSPETGLATAEEVLRMLQAEVSTRQEAVGIPEESRIGIQVLQPPTVIQEVADGRARAMAVVGVVGTTLSLLVTVLLDDIVGLVLRWKSSWRTRRSAHTRGGGPETSGSTQASEDA